MKTILLCSDLDRTLIPNGEEPESLKARPVLAHLTAHPNVRLAYVSGRDKDLVQTAMQEFDLPTPNFVIGDVGTTLYHIVGGQWQIDDTWQEEIGHDWRGYDRKHIVNLLSDVDDDFHLQDEKRQGRYKISYFTNPTEDARKLKNKIAAILNKHDISANLIWSRDDVEKRGLLDILPQRANKLEAIRHLIRSEELDEQRVVFAGDSGNDLDALTSGLNAILVKNAADDVHKAATDRLSQPKRLYRARGNMIGMNGNYAAGVLEGVIHFFPEIFDWIAPALDRSPHDHT
jgi:sucrose-6F-phosphate phosphohydrolase